MTDNVDSNLEIRRILLLTRLRSAPHGMTLSQLVKDCGKVAGWNIPGQKPRELVLLVVQSLIDDGLASVAERFSVTTKGRQYLEDPLKWRLNRQATEDTKEKMMLLNSIYTTVYDTVDKVVHRIRSGNLRPSRT